jgi:hypothetical protein
MIVSELIQHLQQLEQDKEILWRSFTGEWFVVNIQLLPCPSWPEYFIWTETVRKKTLREPHCDDL